ncbi:MAG: hypothetical protein J6X35_01800, partial [Bacteroidales bacterium]|nr:hypothetical protein [Bacteroidales bacterium]
MEPDELELGLLAGALLRVVLCAGWLCRIEVLLLGRLVVVLLREGVLCTGWLCRTELLLAGRLTELLLRVDVLCSGFCRTELRLTELLLLLLLPLLGEVVTSVPVAGWLSGAVTRLFLTETVVCWVRVCRTELLEAGVLLLPLLTLVFVRTSVELE